MYSSIRSNTKTSNPAVESIDCKKSTYPRIHSLQILHALTHALTCKIEIPLYPSSCSQKQRSYAQVLGYFTYTRRKWATMVAEVDPSP